MGRGILWRTGSLSPRRLLLIGGVLAAVLLTLLGGGRGDTAHAAADPRYFPQTGFRIDNNAFYDFFSHRGGVRTFGYPTSETFALLGFRVQFFQRQVLQLKPDGSVGLLNLLDPDILPYTNFNFSTFPAVDPSLTNAAPVPGSPNYAANALAFVTAHAPNTFNGAAVNFGLTFLSTVSLTDAFPDGNGNAALLPLMDLELWGLPTSAPMADPANAGFIYLRFQRGIMQYNAATGLTQGILLADYLKAIIIGPSALPPDLAQEAANSPYFQQWAPGQPQFLARPAALPNTDLINAFYQETETGALVVPTATPAPTATATPIGDFCVGDEEMAFAGAGSANIGDTVYISVTSVRNHTNVLLTGPDGPTFVKQYAGQKGNVWQWQVSIKSAGRHDYTYYVDTTVPCTTNYFVIPEPTGSPAPTATASPTATAAATTTATPTTGPKPTISSVNPQTFVSGQVITINGGPFGSPPPGSGANGSNGTVFFFYQPGPTPTPGPQPSATPLSGNTRGTGSVQNWTNTFITVQVPSLTPSLGTNGNYCVQVNVNGAPSSDPFCGLQVSG